MLYSLLKTSEDPVTYLWAVIPMVFISVWLIIWTFNSYIEDQNHWSEKPLKMWSQFWLGLFVGGFWFNLTLIIGQSPKNF